MDGAPTTPGAPHRGEAGADGAVAIVLAGGRSRRLGRPKPFVSVGGRELLQRALDAVAAVCEAVVLVGEPAACSDAALRYGWLPAGADEPAATLRRGGTTLRVVADRRPGAGPLAGLETGWAESLPAATRWWALAADLPFASSALGARLLEELRAWEGSADHGGGPIGRGPVGRAVAPAVDGTLQPLCAAYGGEPLPIASACLDAGERALGAFLDRLQVRAIDLGPGHAHQLLNVNTPAQLERARSRAAERR